MHVFIQSQEVSPAVCLLQAYTTFIQNYLPHRFHLLTFYYSHFKPQAITVSSAFEVRMHILPTLLSYLLIFLPPHKNHQSPSPIMWCHCWLTAATRLRFQALYMLALWARAYLTYIHQGVEDLLPPYTSLYCFQPSQETTAAQGSHPAHLYTLSLCTVAWFLPLRDGLFLLFVWSKHLLLPVLTSFARALLFCRVANPCLIPALPDPQDTSSFTNRFFCPHLT